MDRARWEPNVKLFRKRKSLVFHSYPIGTTMARQRTRPKRRTLKLFLNQCSTSLTLSVVARMWWSYAKPTNGQIQNILNWCQATPTSDSLQSKSLMLDWMRNLGMVSSRNTLCSISRVLLWIDHTNGQKMLSLGLKDHITALLEEIHALVGK